MTSRLGTLFLAALLAGCASLDVQDDQRAIEAYLTDRVNEPLAWQVDKAETDARIHELLAAPIGPGEAVRIALLANPELARSLAETGLSRAEVIGASRLPNPRLSLGILESNRSGARREVETGIAFDLIQLLIRPERNALSIQEYERATLRAAHELVDLATRVEAGWFEYVGARQVAEMRAIIAEAADISSELADRFYQAGNISELQLQRERAAATQARLNAGRAELKARREQLALTRLMGLSVDQHDWQAAERLPATIEINESGDELLSAARANRLDLKNLETQVSSLEQALELSRRWRFLGDVEVGVVRQRGADGERLIGPTLDLRLPIFDQGQASVLRHQSRLERAQAQLRAQQLDVEYEVMQALAVVEASRAIALEYRDALIPQREAIVMRSQEFYDYMFIGAFELLVARQHEYDAYQGYIEAVRDYWLARVELARAAGTTLALPYEEEQLLDLERALKAPEADHGEHGGGHGEHGEHDEHHDHSEHSASAKTEDHSDSQQHHSGGRGETT